MDIILLSVGKINSRWIADGISEFEKRISKYVRFLPKILPDIRKASSLPKEKIKSLEGDNLLAEISPGDFVVILDEKGDEFSSTAWANRLQKLMVSGRKRVVFIIGGPFGFSDEIYNRADAKMALSKMTFTHEMAKLFFTEQIYRAFTILNNEPYHHE